MKNSRYHFSLRHIGAFLSLLVIALAVLCVMPSSAHAATATKAPYCLIVLDKLHPGEQTSRVLSSKCSSQPLAVPHTSTLLAVLYDAVNFGGASTPIVGAYGACDATGYAFKGMPSGWNDRVSSFLLYNKCTHARLYDHAGLQGDPTQSYTGASYRAGFGVSWVGSTMNDKTSSYRLAAAPL